MMRGYNNLIIKNELYFLSKIKDELISKSIFQQTFYSKYFFGASNKVAPLVLKQYLAERVLNTNFNKNILTAIGCKNKILKHPLPKEWTSILNEYGFKAITGSNKLNWFLFKFYYWFLGLSYIFLSIFRSIKISINLKKVKHFSYFNSLDHKCFPSENSYNKDSHDIISWYLSWKDRDKSIDYIFHDIKNKKELKLSNIHIAFLDSPFLPLNFLQLINFLFHSVILCFLSFINIFTNNYEYPLLLREFIKGLHIRLQNKNQIAVDYLFHNSNYIYRPIWTYEAEKKGSRVLFYFYSTNIESFKNKDNSNEFQNFWNLATWSNYLVWDSFQKHFLIKQVQNNLKNINFYIVGVIWFVTTNKKIPKDLLTSKSITIFDVQPVRSSFYQSLGLSKEYYTPNIANSFLEDIQQISDANGFNVILKRKRNIGKLINKSYIKTIDNLSKLSNFNTIDPEIDTIDLISKSNVIISMPFTSTALIAKELGKITVYYDPNGDIDKNDIASHEIPVIIGKSQLAVWMNNIKDEIKTNYVK